MRKGELAGTLGFMFGPAAFGVLLVLLLTAPTVVLGLSAIGVAAGIVLHVWASGLLQRDRDSQGGERSGSLSTARRLRSIGWVLIGASLILGLLISLARLEW